MSGPSGRAVRAATHATDPWTAGGNVRQALAAAHDPDLGLDRSVCLRDVVEALRYSGSENPVVFIEREFGGAA